MAWSEQKNNIFFERCQNWAAAAKQKRLANASGETLQTVHEVLDGDA